ncbi:MAG TPA: hypothetical protein VMT46_17520 [Anaerolineaceae bacterium]|nr:hypothetical protein [Anaerolineaceae bacterium]
MVGIPQKRQCNPGGQLLPGMKIQMGKHCQKAITILQATQNKPAAGMCRQTQTKHERINLSRT